MSNLRHPEWYQKVKIWGQAHGLYGGLTNLGQSSDKEGGDTFLLRILRRIRWVLHQVLHRTNIRTKLSNGAVSPLKKRKCQQKTRFTSESIEGGKCDIKTYKFIKHIRHFPKGNGTHLIRSLTRCCRDQTYPQLAIKNE